MFATHLSSQLSTSIPNAYRGRGSSLAPPNPYEKKHYYLLDTIEYAAEDEPALEKNIPTRLIPVEAKTMLNKVISPDIPMDYSLNPYQGCEHGCAYCYARPTHEYWGMNAGIDFEQTVFYKRNALEVLEKELKKKKDARPIALSGNTDCYQPAERKLRLTRRILKLLLDYQHPVGIITKNALILRDLDILEKMAAQNLVFVYVSITTMEEEIRRIMEPRSSSISNRFKILEELSRRGIPCGTLIAPVIPGINNMHIPAILKRSWECGARDAGYTVVRLNDIVSEVFKEWLKRNLPDRFDKVWNLISQIHGGSVSDKRFGTRLRGEGPMAELIKQLFTINKNRYFTRNSFTFNESLFLNNTNRIPQLRLF